MLLQNQLLLRQSLTTVVAAILGYHQLGLILAHLAQPMKRKLERIAAEDPMAQLWQTACARLLLHPLHSQWLTIADARSVG
jgi:hypothetical protein